MAWSTVETKIANPAGKVRRMAKLSPAQIRAGFGGRRRKIAAKARRRAAPKKRRASARKRSNPHKHRASARPKRRAVARKSSAPRRHRRRKAVANRAKRRNPVPQIIAWTAGNPAKRRSSMKRKKRRASARRSNAGTRHYRRRTKAVRHHRRRRNPGALGSPMDWITGGAGVVAGGLGSRVIPQMILGASNTGAMGYLANAVTALALGWGAHALFKRNILTVTVIAGGFGSLIQRIVTEQTPYGAALSQPSTGLGDWGLGLYQKSNYLTPQRIQGPSGPASSNFYWGDGSQAPAASTYASAGSDSTSPC
jgi:hypothetical protein